MTATPPPVHGRDENGTDRDGEDWRRETRPLGYPGHDIRVIIEGALTGNPEAPRSEPATFGDFDPPEDGPDPDVWPLEGFDPGAPAPLDDLRRITRASPAPHVRWVTDEYIVARHGYNPYEPTLAARDLPPWKRPRGAAGNDPVTVSPRARSSIEYTKARLEALRRLARLWNGEVVQGVHLLADKCPRWEAIFGDLPDDDLARLVQDPQVNGELAEAFGDCEWFDDGGRVALHDQRILGRRVWYAPTQLGRTLISRNDDLPDLRGDPREGLRHRVTVGLTALRWRAQGFKVETYHPVGDYVVDVVGRRDGETRYGEVVTGHRNWDLHRATYRKLAALEAAGTPWVVCDARDTAYELFNFWQRENLGALPNGEFDSHPRIGWGREKVREAFDEDGAEWAIADWTTTSQLWRTTLGPDGLEAAHRIATSHDW